nr:GDP-mannose transporter GONST1-like isoform X2 [Physcomitrium patens]|eukprot:XP_024397509.1 GDP-mannose transporter GONST1-like isoform X2 [Physcomitrella patens]
MILLNKTVLSGYGLKGGIALMFYQNVISVLLVVLLEFSGAIVTEPVTWRLVKVWFPVNCLFVGMLVTSTYSLKFMNVAMVTILKNVTNLITACGEIYFFNKHHSNKVWASLLLMVTSAISGGITDLSFHAVGYAWQIVNCFCTSAYSLRLRKVMDLAKQKTVSGTLNEFSMVLLNNLLSIPLGFILILIFERDIFSMPALRIPMFWVVATMSGVLGLAISFTSMWFLHQTSPTTHSLVGSLNKIPLSLAGIMIFKVPTSVPNMFSIFFGLFAGVMFAKAKMSG